MARSRKRRSSMNPFVSLTDILFNLILLLIFASALFAQDIAKKFDENRAFQARLAAIQLERDDLIANVKGLTEDLSEAELREAELQSTTLSLEEQIGILVANLDSAQARQDALKEQISVIMGDLDAAEIEKGLLEDKITVILGDLEGAEEANVLLQEDITVLLGTLSEAEQEALRLRGQVSELSRNNFLVVELEWLTENHDLDLHVVDPRGNRFYFNQPSYPDENARLTLDNRQGARPNKPGLEIWTARELELGTYQIQVGLWGCNNPDRAGYQTCTEPSSADVLVRHRDGDEVIENINIPVNSSYAQLGPTTFSLHDGSFDKLITVAEVEVYEEDDELKVIIKPADGLEVTRLAGN